MSSMDKTLTNTFYEFEIDPESYLPRRIRMLVLAGTKGGTEREGRRIVGGEHVSMMFDFRLDDFGEIEKPDIPAPALKLLAGR